MARRRRILARLRKRRNRGRPGGTALIPPDEVAELQGALNAVNRLQLNLLDRLARKGQQPKGDTLTLFRHLAEIRGTLTPHLTNAREELVEIRRPSNYDEYVERVINRHR